MLDFKSKFKLNCSDSELEQYGITRSKLLDGFDDNTWYNVKMTTQYGFVESDIMIVINNETKEISFKPNIYTYLEYDICMIMSLMIKLVKSNKVIEEVV